jgi:transketolase
MSEELARSARVSALTMCSRAKAAHIASSLSAIDILAVLYAGVARVDAARPDQPDRDIVLMSKGHAAAGLYAVLGNAGFLPQKWLDEYCQDGGILSGHVTATGIPGVELSTGSLGHALPVGVGLALGHRLDGGPQRVFAVLSDGECDEGSNWEAALLAGHLQLDRLTVVIDRNGLQSLTSTEQTVRLEPLADKWRAFGWRVSEVDGHDHAALAAALELPGAGPHVVIARTIKGRGVDWMENTVLWHYRPPSEEQLEDAIAQVRSAP